MAGLEAAKAHAGETGNMDELAASSSELHRFQQAANAALVDLFRAARRDDPEGAAACEQWGRQDEAQAAAVTALAVEIAAEADEVNPTYPTPIEEVAA